MKASELELRVRHAIQYNDFAVERAVVLLYERQTEDEKHGKTTLHSNGRGFSGAHASIGTYWAKWIKDGRRLTGSHLARARVMVSHYVGQLTEEAALKAASEAAERAAIQDAEALSGEDPPSTLRSRFR